MEINSTSNQSAGYSLFFFNYGFDSTMPINLVNSDEQYQIDSFNSFHERMIISWNSAMNNLKEAVNDHEKYNKYKTKRIQFSSRAFGFLKYNKIANEGYS